MICVEKFTDEFIVGFKKALNDSNLILEHINKKSKEHLRATLKTLSSAIKGLNEIVDPIWKQVETDVITYQRANAILLRCIPLLNIYGFEHFLNSIYQSNKESEDFIEQIYPNFINEFSNFLFLI